MSSQSIQLMQPILRARPPGPRVPLGRMLVDAGLVTASQMLAAVGDQVRCDARLGEILVARGLLSEPDLMRCLARQWDVPYLDDEERPADAAPPCLSDPLDCLAMTAAPWSRIGNAVLWATSDPEAFEAQRARLERPGAPVLMGVATRAEIQAVLADRHGAALARHAETRVAEGDSCRGMGRRPVLRGLRILAGFGALAGLAALAPEAALLLAYGLALVTLVMAAGLKAAALGTRFLAPSAPSLPIDIGQPARLPRMSILVPLNRETEIASRLVRRLSRLDYPKALLDVILVLEADDRQTRTALDAASLPAWMSVIEVPEGRPRTKPRALNYALPFARGSIVGVYDAEDAPAPDQLTRVAQHFRDAAPEVACLQGILDYYNPRRNWMSRCFTIEYATWFRILLPGIARLGLAVPLGGTTLFFRREALDALGGWDAHSVTEDADLGMRLARHGYRTELIATETAEEANCRPWPWVRQRSRWLKGYMITYLVHMREPRRLYRDLGPRKFWGFQVFFGATLAQFLLAPLLWSLWLVLAGLPHPLGGVLPAGWLAGLAAVMAACGLVSLAIHATAVSGPRHRWLTPWVLTLGAYFPMATLAAYKGLVELILVPFYWDKTAHGQLSCDSATPAAPRSAQPEG